MATVNEQPNLGEVKPGDIIQGFYILRKCELRSRKDGSPFLALEITDRTGRIPGKIWQDAENYVKELVAGEVAKIRGTVQEYQGQADLKIDKIRMATGDDPVDPEKLLKTAAQDLEALYQKLLDAIAGFKNDHLKRLLLHIFEDEEFRKQFSMAPGGKLWHHAEFGGLMVHTVSMVEVCRWISGHYAGVDGELLMAGALLHDVGKIEELGGKWAIDYTDLGRLIGHLAQGAILVDRAIQEVGDFPPELRMQLLHLIVSHHGNMDKGAPVLPKTVEALILSYIDELDAQVNAWQHIIERDKDGRSTWSSYVRLIDRYLYLGTPEEDTTNGEE